MFFCQPMKRALLILLIALGYNISYSQQYQCLQSGNRRYFCNAAGYLRGMRIDSVRTYADSVIFFPFHTCRGNTYTGSGIFHLDSNGGSWLGKKVISLADGTFLFDNVWNDTIVIKTQANIGDSWTFYSDSSNVYYKADLISKSVRTIFGAPDSVKIILIRAFDRDTGLIPSDPVTGYQISVSKNYGFYDVFDLYFFPHRRVYSGGSGGDDTTDYFFQKCGPQKFQLVDFYNPPVDVLYDFGVGDVFQYKVNCATGTDPHCTRIFVDTIAAKTAISSTQTAYTIRRRGYYNEIWTLTVSTGLSFDTVKMPEEKGINGLYYYEPDNNAFCMPGHYYKIMSGTLFDEFEPCGQGAAWKIGHGQVYESECENQPSGFVYSIRHLIYTYKNGVSCGTFIPMYTSVDDRHMPPNEVRITPNPADNQLRVSLSEPDNFSIALVNMLGQTVLAATCTGGEESINIGGVPAGLYNIRVVDITGNRYVQKISIVH
jgi:hypothetical protein